VKILIVDDHILFREGLVNILENNHDEMTVVGEAGSVHEALQKTLELQPDLVLMDINLPDGNGVDAVKTILAHRPETLIVMLTVYETDELLFISVRNGAVGYLLKSTPASKLIQSLVAIRRGEAAISRTMTLKVLEEFHRAGGLYEPAGNVLSILTNRELEVFRLLGMDSSNKEIAENLTISINTAKIHVHNILKKLDPFTQSLYSRVAMKYPRPLTPVINGTCYGCFVAVPTAIATDPDERGELNNCAHCGRHIHGFGPPKEDADGNFVCQACEHRLHFTAAGNIHNGESHEFVGIWRPTRAQWKKEDKDEQD